MSNTPKVEYRMKEVCAWSVGDDQIEHHYVDVVITYPNGTTRTETLQLPSTEAVHLCASMATDKTIEHLLQEKTENGWYFPSGGCALPGLMQRIAQVATNPIAWLKHMNLKYVEVRVDMRFGHFIVKDSFGKEAGAEVMDLLEIKLGQ
jgi:hypothetical protein